MPQLPIELIVRIINFLNGRDVLNIRLVCCDFQKYAYICRSFACVVEDHVNRFHIMCIGRMNQEVPNIIMQTQFFDFAINDNYLVKWAGEHGNLEFIQFLVQRGVDIHAGYDYALRWAARNGYFEIVRYLCSYGANIHAFDSIATRWADRFGHHEIVIYLQSLA